MRRWLFHLLALLSLLLCLASVALWIRSPAHDWWYRATFNPATRFFTNTNIRLNDGQLWVDVGWLTLPPGESTGMVNYPWAHISWDVLERHEWSVGPDPRWRWAVYHFSRDIWMRRPGQYYYELGVRIWLLMLFTAMLPAWWIWRTILLRRRRQLAGLCPTCRYDLRAHKPGDKCPECGTLVTAKPDVNLHA